MNSLALPNSRPNPPGVTLVKGGANVSVFSSTADIIYFCLFNQDQEIARYTLPNNDYGNFHGFIPGVKEGDLYGFRADGEYNPAKGLWFDPNKLLIDPYATKIDRPFLFSSVFSLPRGESIDTADQMPKCVVEKLPVVQLRPVRELGFIYELNVMAFSKLGLPGNPNFRNHPNAGKMAALVEPESLEHFKKLGVNTIELMPCAAWINERHLDKLGLTNGWGYNPVAFGLPEPRLLPGGISEFAKIVETLHDAGFNVILDLVFNHSGESDEQGSTLSLRGLEGKSYFRQVEGKLINDTGCGNTIAADSPAGTRLIMDLMRRWVMKTGVDGFRFDLATTLFRNSGKNNEFDTNGPFAAALNQDPVLRGRIQVMEPWDIGPGGYQLGCFPPNCSEWNGAARDTYRRFSQGKADIGELVYTMAGSAEIFKGRKPSSGVNFICAHDGFTLSDLVSFSTKHNEANGEENRDGTNENYSQNFGHEGPTDDPKINFERDREIRFLLTLLFLSKGSPMLTAGDEIGRTQNGNNNAYCQDNEMTWLNWENSNLDRLNFVAGLSDLRKSLPYLTNNKFFIGETLSGKDVLWLDERGELMTEEDWRTKLCPFGFFVPETPGSPKGHHIWVNPRNEFFVVPIMPGEILFSSEPINDKNTLSAKSIAVFKSKD